MPTRLFFLSILFAVLTAAPSGEAAAQQRALRFGAGFNAMLSTANGVGVGLGFRGRASAPVNVDLSVAVDAGFTGFVLQGRDQATYVFDPQLSAIINLPQQDDQLAYLLFGAGAYLPFGPEDRGASGPTLHAGIGWVRALHETSLFYEIDPALIVGEHGVDLALPVRVGIIF